MASSIDDTLKALSATNKTLQPLLDYVSSRSRQISDPTLTTAEDARVLSALALTLTTLVMIEARLDGVKVKGTHDVRSLMTKVREASKTLEKL